MRSLFKVNTPKLACGHAQNDLFLEQVEGYVKALEKSTSRILSLEMGF